MICNIGVLKNSQGATGSLAELHVDLEAQVVGDGVGAGDDAERPVLSGGLRLGWSGTCVELE